MENERIFQMLSQRRIGYVCTAGPKNRPHLTPIFIIYDPNTHRIYFQANRKSKKVRDIMGNPLVSLTIDSRDEKDPFKNEGVMVRGDAKILETELKKAISEDLGIAFDVFVDRFYDVVVKGEPGEKVVVEVSIDKMVYWRGPRFQTVRV
jgi:nitroimidazol reductase NimA-like FMN-containing flavoprotein (pyridoxamine 5'-phosphate oxidase superfamily)